MGSDNKYLVLQAPVLVLLGAATFLTAGSMGILVTLLGSVVPILKSRRMRLVEEIKAEQQFRICSEL